MSNFGNATFAAAQASACVKMESRVNCMLLLLFSNQIIANIRAEDSASDIRAREETIVQLAIAALLIAESGHSLSLYQNLNQQVDIIGIFARSVSTHGES